MEKHRRFTGVERLRTPERLERLEVDRVVDLALQGQPVRSVIDIGTGSGIFAEAFAARGLLITGIDPNPEMLTAARKYVPSGDFREAPAEAIPFPDDSFDIAFLGLVLHETDDPPRALKEARRVSRYGVMVLEWPYTGQSFGPELEERFRPEEMLALAKQVGVKAMETVPLTSLIMYRLLKGNR